MNATVPSGTHGGASWGVRAGGGTVGDTHYRCFLNGAAAWAELKF